MRPAPRALGRGLLWGLTACLATLEILLAGSWLRGTLYITRYGAAENPYAAENTEITGFCALVLLPPALAALAWAVCETAFQIKHGRRPDERNRGENDADDIL